MRPEQVVQPPPTDFADFTEDAYRSLVTTARPRFAFEPFGTTCERPHVLWRHDVDFSVHRALALARIEAEAGARSTWFLHPQSAFYNLLESEVLERARRILDLGHWLGLHFDPSAHPSVTTEADLGDHVDDERRLLERRLGHPVTAVSLHNPDVGSASTMRSDRIAGLPNAFARSLDDRYTYVSDSNGYWRYRRLPEVLADPGIERLHVLTHPEWWVPSPMSPRERVARAAEGRARAVLASYDELLDRLGRVNVR